MALDKAVIQEIRTKNRLDDELLKCKGVVGIVVGYKQVKGHETDTVGITVYVEEKLDEKELSTEEAIPKMICGIQTDVIEGRTRLL